MALLHKLTNREPIRDKININKGAETVSKITQKQLEKVCTELNTGVLRDTWYGVEIGRKHENLVVSRKARRHEKAAFAGPLFEGCPKECLAYLVGLKDWVTVPCFAGTADTEEERGERQYENI